MMHPAENSIEQLLSQCEIRTTRRSGPGGQHRNKVETAVIIVHVPTGISAEANELRSQQANREVAIHRLRLRLAVEYRSLDAAQSAASEPDDCKMIRDRMVPSDLWKQRVSGGRVAISIDHSDFPAMLAELLDQLLADQWSASETAGRFQLTSSQLVKLLRKHPPALQYFNQQRVLLGLGSLR